MKTTFLIVSFFIGLHSISAQFDYSFEFLQHEQRNTVCGAQHLTADSIIYVNHARTRPYTEIEVVDPTKSVRSAFTLDYWHCGSEKLHKQDGSLEFVLYGLVDYDVLFPGFIFVNFKDGQMTADTLYEEGFINPQVDIVVDDNRNIYYIWNEKIQRIGLDENGEFDQQAIDIEDDFTLFRNSEGQIFAYSGNTVFTLDENLVLESHYVTPTDILDLRATQSLHLLLTLDGKLRLMNTDLSDDLAFHTVPESLTSLDLLDYSPTGSFAGIAMDGDDLRFFTQQNNTFVWENGIDLYAQVHPVYLEALSSNELIIQTQYEVPDFNNQLGFWVYEDFYRVEQNPLDVRIDSIYFAITEKEENENNPPTYTYQLTIDGANYGMDMVEQSDVYSADEFYFDMPFHYEFPIDQMMETGNTFRIDTTFSVYAIKIEDLQMGITGANYRHQTPAQFLDTNTVFLSAKNPTILPIKIYPNPAVDFIYFENVAAIQEIQVFDASGRLIVYQKATQPIQKLNVTTLPSGSYQLISKAFNRDECWQATFVK